MDKKFEKTGEHFEQPEFFSQGLPKPEKPKSPENFAEQKTETIEKEGNNLGQEKFGEAGKKKIAAAKTPSQLREEAIDRLLSDGLSDIFIKMPPAKQQEFKTEGEKTVKKINKLIEKGKLSLDSLIKIIRKWLSLIPGVNRFFLEQDAKIKADKIMEINKER